MFSCFRDQVSAWCFGFCFRNLLLSQWSRGLEYARRYCRLFRYRWCDSTQYGLLRGFRHDVSPRICRGNFHFRGSETALFHLPGSFKECRCGGRPVTGSILLRKAIRNPVLFRFRAHFAPLFSAPVSVRISLLKLKVLEILIYLSNMKSEHKELTQYFSQQTELIKEIHQQLTEHLDQRFTIAELSKQYLINTSTLKEIFKAVYGQPIATYMKEFRVRQAMKLLRETNDTIADIASQVGYQTQGKFSSAFQSIVKMSPREYRKSRV